MRRLPPFDELVAFEAVARHLSFTRAATELCLTQSAVSHRVRRLEKYFGAQLLHRSNPGLALTEAGTAMLSELVAALNGLEGLDKRSGHRLRVAAGSSLCTWWLAARLPNFMATRPGLSIELVPIENDAASIPQVDVRILWMSEAESAATPTQMLLFNELVFPVCSPRLLPNRRPHKNPQVLEEMILLHKATHATGEWSWSRWFDRLNLTRRKQRRGELRFADAGSMLSAAVDGAGVTLSRSLLAHDALRDGRLMIPVTGFEPMTSVKQHVARWRRDNKDDPDIQAFVAWLVAEAELTLASTQKYINAPLFESSAKNKKALLRAVK